MYIVCVPAYGRDYKSKKEMLKDWNDGKDFQVSNILNKWNGRYFNKLQISDMKKEGVTHLQVRFDRLSKVEIIKM